MAEIQVIGKDGKSVGKHEISQAIAEAKVNQVTAHRAVVAEEANSRQGSQSALTRAEVRGGGRKPYRQKKTGNARQGTISAPHYRHGGVAFAAKPRDYEKKINKKERRAALLGALAAHLEAGNVSVVDSIAFAEPKTKDAVAMLAALGLTGQRRVLVVLPQYDQVTHKCFRNLHQRDGSYGAGLFGGRGGRGQDGGFLDARPVGRAEDRDRQGCTYEDRGGLGQVKNPHDVILRPHITEKAVGLSYGDPRERDEQNLLRKYTFEVAKDANKLEIKWALEAIYNEGKKRDQAIDIVSVRTMKVLGKKRRRGRSVGYEPDRKKAVVTLGRGQMLEDYGV